MSEDLNLQQRRALALAQARLRLQQQQARLDTTDDDRAAATRDALTGGSGQVRNAVDQTIDARAAATQAAMRGGASQPRYTTDTTDDNRAAATRDALGGLSSGQIVPRQGMPENPTLDLIGRGPGGQMQELYDRGILPRRYIEGPAQPAPSEPAPPRVNAAGGANLDTTDDARAARGFGQSGYQSGLMTPGDAAPVRAPETGVLGDVVSGVTSGVGRGVTALTDLPGQARLVGMDLAALLASRATGSDAPMRANEQMQEALAGSGELYAAPAPTRGAVNALTGDGLEYVPETTAGEYAQTVGEFIPGAMIGGGPSAARNILAYGVVPGVASEAAGQATEGTAFEPYARAGAAVGASLLAGPMVGAQQVRPRPVGSNAEQQRLAGVLQSQGVRPTAGQVSGSNMLRRMEGTVTPMQGQLEDVTGAAMRTLGSNQNRATPAALREARDQIGQAMDDALSGVSFRPTSQMAQAADDAVENYLRMAPGSQVVPRARGVADEIIEAATNPNGQPIELQTLREWRTTLGRMLRSNDEATRDVAASLRAIIDDATDAALTAAGRGADLAALRQARVQWRNYIAIRDAATRAGSDAGILSPQQLTQAVIRTQGRENYAIGQGTDLMELSRAAGQTLRPLPTVEAGGGRRLSNALEIGGLGLGGAIGYSAGGWPGAAAGMALGSIAGPTGQAVMRSRATQALLMDPALQASVAGRNALGIYAGR